MLRILVLVLALGAALPIRPARAEDPAAILAAMPTKAAEQRYLKELCARIARADQQCRDAIDDFAACHRRRCEYRALYDASIWKEGACMAHTKIYTEHSEAVVAYRAKRNASPPVCEAATVGALNRLSEKLAESTAELSR